MSSLLLTSIQKLPDLTIVIILILEKWCTRSMLFHWPHPCTHDKWGLAVCCHYCAFSQLSIKIILLCDRANAGYTLYEFYSWRAIPLAADHAVRQEGQKTCNEKSPYPTKFSHKWLAVALHILITDRIPKGLDGQHVTFWCVHNIWHCTILCSKHSLRVIKKFVHALTCAPKTS